MPQGTRFLVGATASAGVARDSARRVAATWARRIAPDVPMAIELVPRFHHLRSIWRDGLHGGLASRAMRYNFTK